MECFDHLLRGPDPENAVISNAEMRRNAPSFGQIVDCLRANPKLLVKTWQGLSELQVVPYALPPEAFKAPIAGALRQFNDTGTLRSTDGTPLRLHTDEPVWMWDGYGRPRAMVYFPQRYSPDHGGKTKEQVIAEGPQQSAGWMVFLREKSLSPGQGRGQTIAGRPQIEAGKTPHKYLALLKTEPYAGEQYLPPEAGLARLLDHLEGTGGQVLYDHCQADGGTSEYFLGGCFASGSVPYVFWYRCVGQVIVVRRDPKGGGRNAGACSGARVV
jgi:hypothetical protein